jgi:xanthine dehydrogenase molybdopterin-binding subunit B
VPDHALGRTAAQRIEDAMMTGSRHAYQIDFKFDRGVDN